MAHIHNPIKLADTPDALEVALTSPRPALRSSPPSVDLSVAACAVLEAFTNPDGLRLGRAAAAAWQEAATRALTGTATEEAATTRLTAAWRMFTSEFPSDLLRAEYKDEVDRDAMVVAYQRSAGGPDVPLPRDALAMKAGRLVATYVDEWTHTYAKYLRASPRRHGVPGMSAEELCEHLGTALLVALRTPSYFEDCARPGYPASLLVMLEARNRLRIVRRVRVVRPEDLTVYSDGGRGSPDAAVCAREEAHELRELFMRAQDRMSPDVRKWCAAALEWVDDEGSWEGRLNGAEIGRALKLDKSTASRMLPKVREALRQAGAEDFVRKDGTVDVE